MEREEPKRVIDLKLIWLPNCVEVRMLTVPPTSLRERMVSLPYKLIVDANRVHERTDSWLPN
jgi:hypothetical protein